MAEREEPRVSGTTDHQRDQERRFAALYQAYYRPILAYAVRRVAPAEDAADVVADVFTTAWRRIDQVPGPRPIGCGCTEWRSEWSPGGADQPGGCFI